MGEADSMIENEFLILTERRRWNVILDDSDSD